MDYRLIALDLDGTLLNDDGVLSAYNTMILQRCQKAGAVVTLATGRIHASALPFARSLALQDIPLITSHGAVIRCADGPIIAHYPLDETICWEIYRQVSPLHKDLRFYADDQLYLNDFSPASLAYAQHIGISPKPLPQDLTTLHPTKLALVDTPEVIAYYEALFQATYGARIYMTKVSESFLEISNPQATKGLALAALTEALQLSPGQVIAFGDSYNDLPMLQYAGCAVAMGNANAAVKAVCDHIADSNNHDGVGKFLAQLLAQ